MARSSSVTNCHGIVLRCKRRGEGCCSVVDSVKGGVPVGSKERECEARADRLVLEESQSAESIRRIKAQVVRTKQCE